MTLNELQNKLADWHLRAKGAIIDPIRTTLKAAEELGELAKDILKGDYEGAKMELADVLLVLSHLARFLKVDMVEVMEKKYYIIEERLKQKNKNK